MRRGYLFALALAGYFSPARACAQTSRALSEAEVHALLHEQAHRARTHRYAWTAINAGLALGSFGVTPLVPHETRKDYIVGGIASALGAVITLAFPLNVESDEAQLSQLDALPPGERRRKLTQLLSDAADDERDRIAWPWHLVNFGASSLTGGIIAVGFGHVRSGIQTGVIGFALGEVQLFTQPMGLVGAHWHESASLRWQPLVQVQEHGLSVGLLATF